ncbi:MAG: tyrosine-type recombinase/integrase [Planctomycetota bacterium]|nr:tyrosine-type recombinase/integrase [Planctomycetota bacterium]
MISDVRPAEIADELPELVARGGAGARFAYEEFFYGRLRNPHTRKAYRFAVHEFLARCETLGIELPEVTPRHVSQYLDSLDCSHSTRKQRLSALRHFFDELVLRHVVVLNPAASVRGERYQVVEGKTPEIGVDNARRLLTSIRTDNAVGLRDRSIIGILIYTAARVGAVSRLRRQDFYDTGDQYCLHFVDKGGKSREIPVRHDLQGMLFSYIAAAELGDADGASPLFRSADGRTGRLTDRPVSPGDIARMVKRRLRDAGLPARLSPHSFRVTTVTDLLTQGIPLEEVQFLAGHADPRTTRLYDRRQRRVTRNIVERISI